MPNNKSAAEVQQPFLPTTMLSTIFSYCNDNTLFALSLCNKAYFGLIIQHLKLLQDQLLATIKDSKLIFSRDQLPYLNPTNRPLLLSKDTLVLTRQSIQYATENQSDVTGIVKAFWQKWENEYVLTNDGKLWVCGNNDIGQLGLGEARRSFFEFTQVQSLNDHIIMQVISTPSSACVLTDQGKLFVSGYSNTGWGNKKNYFEFTQVQSLNDHIIIQVIDMYASAYALTNQGKLFVCSGSEHCRDLGFTQVQGLNDHIITQVISMNNSIYALTNQGKLFVYTANGSGLRLQDRENCFEFMQVQSLNDHIITQVISADSSVFVLTDQGKLFACGSNHFGQLGLGNNRKDCPEFTQIQGLNDHIITQVIPNEDGTYVLTNKGKILMCGQGSSERFTPISQQSPLHIRLTKINNYLQTLVSLQNSDFQKVTSKSKVTSKPIEKASPFLDTKIDSETDYLLKGKKDPNRDCTIL